MLYNSERVIMFTKFTKESFEAFMVLLKNFDFYYSYSDDIRVYRRGKSQEEEIDKIRKTAPQFEEVYNHWLKNYTTKDGDAEAVQKLAEISASFNSGG